jgi:glycosyltransferase involved in cell wall biosynthesis
MNSDLIISVIIPVYNSEKTIKECLLSVIKQTILPYEIIVVDDGSSDRSLLISSEFKNTQKLINLRIIKQTNGGPSKARNTGIRNSKGNWIAFLDSDDIWLPNKLEEQLKILNINKECKLIGTNGDSSLFVKKATYNYISFFSMFFKNQFMTSSVLIEKNLLEKFYFDESMSYAEDCKLWMQVLRVNMGIILSDKFVIYGSNLSDQNNLSSNLWLMQKGELSNFNYFFKLKAINFLTFISASIFSLLKYIYRFMKVRLRM